MTIQELLILSPIMFLALGALIAILLEITTRNVSHVIYVSIVFLILSFLASMNLWNGWTNTPIGSPILGESFSVDHFAIFFYFLIIPVGAATLLMMKTLLDKMDFDRGEMIILLLLSLTGMMALVSSRDLLAIYVSLELASLPLIALGAIRKNGYALEVGVKFLVMSSVSTATLLYGFIILYGLTGSTNLDQILYELKNMDSLTPALMFSIVAIIAGFGFKMSLVPWQSWVPDFYQGAPVIVVAFVSVASKAAAFAVVVRIFLLAMNHDGVTQYWIAIFAVISALTMIVGNLIALRQTSFKRLLGYSSISQAGYMLIGIASISTGSLGLVGLLYYLAGYAFTNLTVFFTYGAILSKSDNDEIYLLKGLLQKSPLIAVSMVIAFLSLIGMPATVGFMGKLFVFSSAVDSGILWLAILGGISTVVGAFYYLRVIKTIVFDTPESDPEFSINKVGVSIQLIGAIGILFFGIFPSFLIHLSKTAIESLM